MKWYVGFKAAHNGRPASAYIIQTNNPEVVFKSINIDFAEGPLNTRRDALNRALFMAAINVYYIRSAL